MRNTTLTLIAFASCLVLFLTGCGGSESDGSSHETHSEDDGHDHGSAEDDAHSEDDGHVHGSAEDDTHSEEDEHEHGDEVHDLGSVTVAGTILSVSVGHVEAGSEVDVELARTGGTVPTGIRVWVGPESGIGSMKVKADAHDDHFHAHVEVPEELNAEARLWIQVAATAGKTETQGFDLPNEEHEE